MLSNILGRQMKFSTHSILKPKMGTNIHMASYVDAIFHKMQEINFGGIHKLIYKTRISDEQFDQKLFFYLSTPTGMVF